ncbi:hypothetical protein [Vulgatibacter sp.]|uniref:hypothetical protein n=1 Tax=Vulgatibacter sp. TaxID=1971226 RepID=UPI0035684995
MKQAVVVGLLTLLPGLASAQSLRLTNSTAFEYRGQNDNGNEADDEFGLGVNRLYLNGSIDRTSVTAQVDSIYFSAFPDLDYRKTNNIEGAPTEYQDEARLERITLVHTLGAEERGTLTAGDAHLQLGRGIALALRKVDEIGTNQALRGGSLAWNGDEYGGIVFAGRTNIANLDGPTMRYLEDPNDVIAGASGSLFLGRSTLSVHGLYLKALNPYGAQGDDVADGETALGGAYVETPVADWLTLYVEGAFEQYRIDTLEEQGVATYASADVDLQFASLLLEGLYLDQFQVMGSKDNVLNRRNTYNQPPTLERIDQEVLDNENVRGGRVKLSRSFLDGSLVLYTSGMFRQYGKLDAEPVDAIHAYGGFEHTYGFGASRWYASGGYRQETEEAASEPFKRMVHGETDWVQSIGGGWATHLTINHESRYTADVAVVGNEGGRDYIRGSTFIGLDRAHLGSVMVEIGYDTLRPDVQQNFLAGIVTWEAVDWADVRAVVGSQRGGIKCVGGVCRDFPPFSGARLEATVFYDTL